MKALRAENSVRGEARLRRETVMRVEGEVGRERLYSDGITTPET
jgi:hypothetical protein